MRGDGALRLLSEIDGKIVAQHAFAAPGVRLVQDPAHLPPKPKPCHERFAQLGDIIVERVGEVGRQYVSAVESRAPHAPLSILREVLERSDEYGTTTVQKALQSLLEFAVVKRGMLSRLCERFGPTPQLNCPANMTLPDIKVEQRELSVYDGAAA